MTVTSEVREEVRRRANFACEFCGVSEADSGGELTVDHFRPIAQAGTDDLENLLYCCFRCNQYKADYWPMAVGAISLWNPRSELFSTHFLELDDGTLRPLSAIGAFTLRRLRLNRSPLVINRQRRQQTLNELRLLARYRDLVQVLESLLVQQTSLMEEQRVLLKEQSELLRLLIDKH